MKAPRNLNRTKPLYSLVEVSDLPAGLSYDEIDASTTSMVTDLGQ